LNTLLKNSVTKVLICSAPADGHVRAFCGGELLDFYGVQSVNKPLAMKDC
jgi:hypothetical protein